MSSVWVILVFGFLNILTKELKYKHLINMVDLVLSVKILISFKKNPWKFLSSVVQLV